jgi:class 3 adenylate cyclase
MLHVHRAERADRLIDGLSELLVGPLPDPFAAEFIAVHTRGMERWVSQQLSAHLGTSGGRADGVCANVEFPSPAKLVRDAVATASGIDGERDPWLPERLAACRRHHGELRVGIGVNSGRVVVGTIGGGGRLDFTVIGDPVNTAARVESATRQTDDDLLITEATRSLLRADLGDWEQRPAVPLKGKEPYRVISDSLAAPARVTQFQKQRS